jgi:hypothetical protein
VGDAFGDEASWYQIRGAKLGAHADSFMETSKQHRHNCIKTESGKLDADME